MSFRDKPISLAVGRCSALERLYCPLCATSPRSCAASYSSASRRLAASLPRCQIVHLLGDHGCTGAGQRGRPARRPYSFEILDKQSLICFPLSGLGGTEIGIALNLDYEFVAYIDEAGDPGLRAVAPIDPNGSSEWMTLGCVLIRKKYEKDVVRWVRDIRLAVRAVQGPALHYRRLSRAKRLMACKMLAQLPVRAIVLASNKKTCGVTETIVQQKCHPRSRSTIGAPA